MSKITLLPHPYTRVTTVAMIAIAVVKHIAQRFNPIGEDDDGWFVWGFVFEICSIDGPVWSKE